MDGYERITSVGRGAFGVVYLCRRRNDNNFVIVKQITMDEMSSEECENSLNEIRVLAMLNHPNIIRYHDSFSHDRALNIVMEYAEGGTLFEFLQRQNELLPQNEILRLSVQIILAIHHIHSNNVLHRDLKTQNILLCKCGAQYTVKIGDFGISKVLSSKSKANTVVGTPCYISPELCEGKPYNQKSDIWALGCVLYELATLRRAFEASNLPALVLKIMRGTFAPISEKYSSALTNLVLSMLNLNPIARPSLQQVLSLPLIQSTLVKLAVDEGCLPCAPRARSKSPPIYEHKYFQDNIEGGSNKSKLRRNDVGSVVLTWGGGLELPEVIYGISSEGMEYQQLALRGHMLVALDIKGRVFKAHLESRSLESSEYETNVLLSLHSARLSPLSRLNSSIIIRQVTCRDDFVALVTEKSMLMTFGSGGSGALGHGGTESVTIPLLVQSLMSVDVDSVSAGNSHLLVVGNSGHDVYACGNNSWGQLGLNKSEQTMILSATPQLVCTPSKPIIVAVAGGQNCSFFILSDGSLMACGRNNFRKLGIITADNVEKIITPTPIVAPVVMSEHPIASVSCGNTHTVIVSAAGRVITFGNNDFGQLGWQGQSTKDNLPGVVTSLAEKKIIRISAGDGFSVAVTDQGEIYSWGLGKYGRLGRGNSLDSFVPRLVRVINKLDQEPYSVDDILCAGSSTILLTSTSYKGALSQE